ncbi:hypothetical protein KJ590_03825, partial [Patescibacteria group bacterium]|nr:hypothetical protein [Patescibacteria group bacterium]
NNPVDYFLDRLFKKNRTPWWNNLAGETRQGRQGRFLQETLSQELTDLSSYRGPGRQLFFFSQSNASSIDGLYKHTDLVILGSKSPYFLDSRSFDR